MTHNQIIIIGYLGRDPEMRYIPSGAGVCSFSVATTEKIKDQDITTWFKISAWGKTGENCAHYLKKGSQVYIEGRLRQTEYTDRDGNKRYTLEVNASNVRFFGGAGAQSSEAPEDAQKRKEALKAKEAESDDQIPF
jgi:single-strand DNA-binding protein